MASIVELSTDNDSADGSISTNTLESIQDGNYIYPYVNARDARLKIRDRIRQAQSEWKVSKILAKGVLKGLNMVFKAVIK